MSVIEELAQKYPEQFLACVLTVFALVLRLLIGRTVERQDVTEALLSLPVDVALLAVSVAAVLTFSEGVNAQIGFNVFASCMVLSMIISFLCVSADNVRSRRGTKWPGLLAWVGLSVMCFAASSAMLFGVTSMLTQLVGG